MINNIQTVNFSKINNNKSITRQNLSIPLDKVSFTGILGKAYSALKRTQNPKDAEELAKLFFSSSEHSFMIGKSKDVKKTWMGKIYDKFQQNLQIKLQKLAVKNDDVYINVVKDSNGKVVGGLSMVVEPEKFVSHVNYVVLAPELKGTRKGKQMLLDMAEKIVENTEKHKAFEITWGIKNAGKPYNRMMSKIKHSKEDMPLSRFTEYSVFTNQLRNAIDNVKSK